MQALVLHKIRPNFDEAVGIIQLSEFNLVACISDLSDALPDTEALEIVFDRTNHIGEDWTSNEGMIVFGDGHKRSTGVGDIVYVIKAENKWVAYQCMSSSWGVIEPSNIK